MPSGRSRVNRVPQMRTDGVHCRESAGTGPVVFKVVQVTSLSHTRCRYEVGMLESSIGVRRFDEPFIRDWSIHILRRFEPLLMTLLVDSRHSTVTSNSEIYWQDSRQYIYI